MPSSLSYTPVDFERQSLSVQLQVAGFNTHAPAFFAWLGVVPYLTGNAFRATLAFIASQSPGSGLTFDYGQPRAVLAPGEQLARDSLASRVELAGEPFQLFFTPADVASELSSGFHGWEDLGATEINARYFRARTDQLAVRGSSGRLVSAWR
jgi:methyltransferase (TIGR00027 family)